MHNVYANTGLGTSTSSTPTSASAKPSQIIESDYIKLNGGWVTISTFTAMHWRLAKSLTFNDVTVQSMDQLLNELKTGLDMGDKLQVYFAGERVRDLATFCGCVTRTRGNTSFSVVG